MGIYLFIFSKIQKAPERVAQACLNNHNNYNLKEIRFRYTEIIATRPAGSRTGRISILWALLIEL